MLPSGIQYPFEQDYNNEVEIVYHRKCWGWRNDIMNSFEWRNDAESHWQFEIETPEQVIIFIGLTALWLDEERWLDDGCSIWTYKEVRDSLVRDICNLAVIYGFMKENPDVYLVFYDSY